MEAEILLLKADAPGGRLDSWITEMSDGFTRSRIQGLIEDGRVRVNGQPRKSNYKVQAGDTVEVEIPEPEPLELVPEDIPLDIVYEDSDIIVINKPRGMVVHPAAGNYTGTLVQALLFHCHDLSGIGGVTRPGIVHRIDKDTTGLLVVAKNDFAHQSLAGQIKTKEAGRIYLALAEGIIKESCLVDAPIGRDSRDRKRMAVVSGGRPAQTEVEPLEVLSSMTLTRLRLHTGRTHQIRVHLAKLGHPVVGDPVYGFKKQKYALDGQLLHAWQLHLTHPRTGEAMNFTAPLPADFRRVLDSLGSQWIKEAEK